MAVHPVQAEAAEAAEGAEDADAAVDSEYAAASKEAASADSESEEVVRSTRSRLALSGVESVFLIECQLFDSFFVLLAGAQHF